MTNSKKYLLVVGGPTASAKTTLSIQLSKHFNAPILSADSRQFYAQLRIGNARPSSDELQQARHLFVADRSVECPLSAGEFAKEATSFLEIHFLNHDVAILVGGSGLFIKALTEGLNFFPEIPASIRKKVDLLFEQDGVSGLQNAVAKADPEYYKIVDQDNHSRLKRALEVCYAGDFTYTYYRTQTNNQQTFIPIYLQTSWPREDLYHRINTRVDKMIEEGLEDEVKGLVKYQNLAALKTVGYQEWFAHFNGEYDKDRAIELIKQNTRRYAKRQLTWFRRDGYWKHLFKGDFRTALAYIHLVQSENVVLLTRQKEEEKHPKYKCITTQLGINKQPIASTLIWKTENDACLVKYELDGLNHIAKNILLHESLLRAETGKVFACVHENDALFFQSMGFEKADNIRVPKCFKEETLKDRYLLVWNRSEQKI